MGGRVATGGRLLRGKVSWGSGLGPGGPVDPGAAPWGALSVGCQMVGFDNTIGGDEMFQ